MRIIKRGTPPEEVEIQTSCHRCKTVFAFTPKEAKYGSDIRDGDYYRIDCPVCRTEVWKSV